MVLAQRVEKLVGLLREFESPPLLVGSSYGGITAVAASILSTQEGHSVAGLVLCAPALARAEPPVEEMELAPVAPTVIIHGISDDIVPIEVSRDYVKRYPQVQLIEVDDGHRLAESLEVILRETRRFLS